MKKVLILGNHAEGLYNFRKELIHKLLEEQYEVHYSVPYHAKVELLLKIGGTYHEIEMNRRSINPIKDIKILKHYYSLIKKVDPDVILTYTIKPNIYGGILASYLKKPVIANITGLGSALQGRGLIYRFVKILYKLGLKNAKYVFFQNESNRDFFIKNNISTENKAFLLKGSGVNIKEFYPIDIVKSDNKVTFLFVGRIMKDKGIDEYIEAAKLIKKEKDNIRFQVLGFFDDDTYKNKIEEFERSGVIEYLGVSDDTRLEMKNADCIVLPSYHEGMSNVLLEGAALGKPLITTNIHGCKEVIDDGENGFLCNPKDAESLKEAINKFINLSEAQRKEMGRLSREKVVKEFDRNIVVDQYIKKINEIIYSS